MVPMYSVDQIAERLNPVFRKNAVRRATLFGSYATGSADSYSDVDLLVDSGLRGLKFFGLLEDVNQCLGCEVDLIDVTQITPGSRIDSEINRTGVLIYEQ